MTRPNSLDSLGYCSISSLSHQSVVCATQMNAAGTTLWLPEDNIMASHEHHQSGTLWNEPSNFSTHMWNLYTHGIFWIRIVEWGNKLNNNNRYVGLIHHNNEIIGFRLIYTTLNFFLFRSGNWGIIITYIFWLENDLDFYENFFYSTFKIHFNKSQKNK